MMASRNTVAFRVLPALLLLALVPLLCCANGFDELKVKRTGPYEFVENPTVGKDGDTVTIRFKVRAFSDVTVAIENPRGHIIRHLASGVLGKNAPPPFQKDSLAQSITWDSKNDQGDYVENLGELTVRVSVGLKPRLERTLFWSPYKRYGEMPLLAAAPEGVYVYDGKAVDFIRFFDHEGVYQRAVYPFPHEKLKDIEGLNWHDFPQGYRLPRKGGLYQVTLLTSGANWHSGNHGTARKAPAARSMAVRGDRMALVGVELCRIGTDGASAQEAGQRLGIRGPQTGHEIKSVAGGGSVPIGPSSCAFSPDGKTVYMTGYLWQTGSWRRVPGCLHAVYKLDYESGEKREVFKGHPTKHGRDNELFCVPTSVACDAKGRVYVTDCINDRVQIYDPSGKHLKTLKATRPAKVCVHQKTGEIWVFSFPVFGVPHDIVKSRGYSAKGVKHTLERFSAYPKCTKTASEPFPLGPTEGIGFEITGHLYYVELDSWTEEPTVWVVGRKHSARGEEYGFSGGYTKADQSVAMWEAGVRLHRKVDGAWKPVRSFGQIAKKQVRRARPPRHNIQRLIVHPITGMLYVAEPDSGPTGKASKQWLAINPETGKIKTLELPFNPMEAVFDLDGRVYLRNTDVIVRYDFRTWREVPWDYGERFKRLGNDGGIYGRTTSVMSGLKMPSTSPVCYHQGGINVGPDGSVIASCAYRYVGISSGRLKNKDKEQRTVYEPQIFPGRVVNSTSPCIHVWDKHGKLLYEDAVPGVGQCDGVAIDRDHNIYVMQAPSRFYNGKRYFNEMSETLMKVRPKKSKVVSSGGSPLKLTDRNKPNRPPDLQSTRHGRAWVTEPEWMYGGVGFAGFNMIGHGGGCACWFARFQLDHFARSIAPEPHQYRVAMLDSAGNLILRVGRFGNVEDGSPLIREGGPENPRSIGGDEVSLVHACFVGTHTDHRLFIADLGNARILSVKLDYHASQRIPLKEVE